MKNGTDNTAYKKYALLFSLLLLLLSAFCVALLLRGRNGNSKITADIYQDGELIHTIELSSLKEPVSFTVTGENGCTNVVAAGPEGIAVTAASCPDKLCVRQGFIKNSLLPITCLPNRLVIQLRTNRRLPAVSDGFDMTTY